MKCAVLLHPGRLEISARDRPVCGGNDVILKVEVCGVCRTDRKSFNMGQRDLKLPRTLGHEITGIIAETGKNVKKHAAGERVQAAPGVFCAECEYCEQGLDHLCDHMQILGFHLDGGFAEYVRIPNADQLLQKVPDGLSMSAAALVEPLACAVNLQKRMSVHQADCVVILGAGPLGILSAKLAGRMGGGTIIIVEPHPARIKIAASCSDYQLPPEKALSEIMRITGSRGADIVIPCCPGSVPFAAGLGMAAKRGRIGFFSGLTSDEGLSHREWNIAHYRELTLTGSYGCSIEDNRIAMAYLASRQIDVSGLPSQTVSWDGLPDSLSSLEPHDHIFTYFIP